LWNLRSWQLLREQSASKYATAKMPREINGIHILIPRVRRDVGFTISSRSEFITGDSMLPLLYRPHSQLLALRMALTALEAFERATTSPDDFKWFSRFYRWHRERKIRSVEREKYVHLSAIEKKELRSLYSMVGIADGSTLVHGDLHASNLVIDQSTNSLGILDLELLHIGHPATNFAQLWIAFHFADPILGGRFFYEYAKNHPWITNHLSEQIIKAEIVVRCYSMIEVGFKHQAKSLMRDSSTHLMKATLSGQSFQQLCTGELAI